MVKAMKQDLTAEDGNKSKGSSPNKIENLQQELNRVNEEYQLQINDLNEQVEHY